MGKKHRTRRRYRGKRYPQACFLTDIESLSPEGRGVARVDGKTVFIDGALPGERLWFQYTARYGRHDEGRTVKVVQAAPERVTPRCPHAEVCGGCSLQHMDPAAQIRFKERALLDALAHVGGVTPERVLPPLTGPLWGYRRKARLGVRRVPKKGRVLVGFREKGSSFLADLSRCEVLVPQVGERLTELGELVAGLSIPDRIAQIEVAAADNATALVFRHLDPLTADDVARLGRFGEESGLQIWLQPGGPDTAHPLRDDYPPLYYAHPDFDVRIEVGPMDFWQVNAAINRAMVARAIELLAPRPDERVLDLFCGLGNFTLPLARRAGEVTGVEGDRAMIRRARAAAAANGITNTRYHVADLAGADIGQAPWLDEPWDAVLLDPPRSGAREVVAHLHRTGARRIVYVSCHPASLARDVGILTAEQGYVLRAAGVMDMFPHTAHVESIALLTRD